MTCPPPLLAAVRAGTRSRWGAEQRVLRWACGDPAIRTFLQTSLMPSRESDQAGQAIGPALASQTDRDRAFVGTTAGFSKYPSHETSCAGIIKVKRVRETQAHGQGN